VLLPGLATLARVVAVSATVCDQVVEAGILPALQALFGSSSASASTSSNSTTILPPPPPSAPSLVSLSDDTTEQAGSDLDSTAALPPPPPPPPAAASSSEPPPMYKPSPTKPPASPSPAAAAPKAVAGSNVGVEPALQIIKAVGSNEQHSGAILAAGLVPCLVSSLSLSMDSLKALAATAIAQLSISASGRASCGDCGAVEALLDLLSGGSNSGLKLEALQALDNLCHFSSANCERLSKNEGGKVLSTLVKEGEPSVKPYAAWTISNVVMARGSDTRSFVDLQMIKALVSAAGSTNDALAMQGVMALHGLAYNEDAKRMMHEAGCRGVVDRTNSARHAAFKQVARQLSEILKMGG